MSLLPFFRRHAQEAAPAAAPAVPVPVTGNPGEQGKKEASASPPVPAKTPTVGKVVSPVKSVPKKKPRQSSGGLAKLSAAVAHFGLGKERSRFIQNLAILLNAGLTLTEGLSTLMAETRVKPMKKIMKDIMDDVGNGTALWRAMDKQNFFTPYSIAMVRIGEESGALAKNMEYLAEQEEKDRALRQKVQMAMIYPSIVLGLTVVITLGLAWFVLPKLIQVLISLGADLPLVTRIIIAIANFFSEHGNVAVPLFAVFCVLLVLVCKYTALRGPTQQLMFKIPGIGSLARNATIARFGVILGSLLRAGVPLIESLRSLAEVTDTVAYKRYYFRLAKEVETGQSFSKAFQSIKKTNTLLPLSVQQLVVTGERSGSLADMLIKIADIYEKKAEDTAHKLPIILEPMLLFFIGGVVGTVALAIIVPIYSIVGSIGR